MCLELEARISLIIKEAELKHNKRAPNLLISCTSDFCFIPSLVEAASEVLSGRGHPECGCWWQSRYAAQGHLISSVPPPPAPSWLFLLWMAVVDALLYSALPRMLTHSCWNKLLNSHTRSCLSLD